MSYNEALGATLIERAIREKIVLVGVTIPPRVWTTPKPTWMSWRCWWTRPARMSWPDSSSPRDRPDPAYFIGKGKAEELRDLCLAVDADTVVFDNELSPAQQYNLEKVGGPRRTGPRPSSTSSPRTRTPSKGGRRWSWRCCATGCRGCVAAAVRAAVQQGAGIGTAVRARPSWRRIGGVSPGASPGWSRSCATCSATASSNGAVAAEAVWPTSPSWGTRTPGSPPSSTG